MNSFGSFLLTRRRATIYNNFTNILNICKEVIVNV